MGEPVAVTYFAALVDLTGRRTETFDVASRTVGELRSALARRYPGTVAELAQLCVVLSGDALLRRDDDVIGARVDLLPPFAGG
ncbi:MAG: MoaD/ThiS family protein [Gordonia sp. (in: high G+C Gram-positive bacteria)]